MIFYLIIFNRRNKKIPERGAGRPPDSRKSPLPAGGGDDPAVQFPGERLHLAGAVGRRARGHVDLLIPLQHGEGGGEIGHLPGQFPQFVKIGHILLRR